MLLTYDQVVHEYGLPVTEGNRGDPRWPAFARRYGFDMDGYLAPSPSGLGPATFYHRSTLGQRTYQNHDYSHQGIFRGLGRGGPRYGASLLRAARSGARQATENAVWAAYADALSKCAALGRDELREAARAVMEVTSGRG
ncbi:hypothetical protein NRF20_43470 [Streptomyces sp. R-74717]|uniref:hypothetical protein n=1 Tax=Streptomyces sp. R-74717 TaxID=2969820 RepID=UPI0039B59B55